ncbi:MAG TPA: hypothetical protein VFR18_11595, partial [Terriglobia bacterium]|nr:hypothetical protein [Terriglobia bacterium]
MKITVTLTLAFALPMLVFAPSAVRAQFSFGGPEQPMLARFDKDGDKKLNAAERKAALSALGGGGGFYRRSYGAGRPGLPVSPSSVRNVPESVPFYNGDTLRTLFFQFEDDNWERELMTFKETDIEVPAT